MALWDIKAKALGVPLHRLFGDGRAAPGHAVCLALADRADARRVPRFAGREDPEGPGAGLPGGEAGGLRQRAVQPQRPPGERRRGGGDRRRLPQGGRARDGADGRRRLRLARRQDGPRRPRAARPVRPVLRRDPDRHRRPRRLRLPARPVADPDRGGGVAEHALRVPRPGRPRPDRRAPARRRPRGRLHRGAARSAGSPPSGAG